VADETAVVPELQSNAKGIRKRIAAAVDLGKSGDAKDIRAARIALVNARRYVRSCPPDDRTMLFEEVAKAEAGLTQKPGPKAAN